MSVYVAEVSAQAEPPPASDAPDAPRRPLPRRWLPACPSLPFSVPSMVSSRLSSLAFRP